MHREMTVYVLLQHDRTTTSTLAEYSHSSAVTAEEMDILLNPVQRQLLIEYASVGDTITSHFIGAEEAKCAELWSS